MEHKKPGTSWKVRLCSSMLAVSCSVIGLHAEAFAADASQATAPVFRESGSAAVNVTLNGHKLLFDVSPILLNDRTMVPFRVLLEAVGAQVSWDQHLQTAYAKYNGHSIEIPLNSYVIYEDSHPYTMDVPILMIGDRTLVPMRFVVEALGFQVSWDQSTQTASVAAPAQDSSQSPGANTGSSVPASGGTSAEPIPKSLYTQDQLIKVVAGDPAVTDQMLQHAVDLLNQHRLLANDALDLAVPQRSGITIQLAYSANGYQQLLQANGFTQNEASSTVESSSGVTLGQTIFLPIEGVSDLSLTRTLAHELVHVLLNQYLGSFVTKLPIWFNEGFAWMEGLKQGYAGDGAAGGSYSAAILEAIIEDKIAGRLPSLVQDDTHQDNYESHGYAAVEWLLDKKGLPTLQRFIQAIKIGDSNAFFDQVGLDIASVNDAVNADLTSVQNQADAGVDVTLTIGDSFQGTLVIYPFSTHSAYLIASPAAGRYVLHIASDGTITGMPGISPVPIAAASRLAPGGAFGAPSNPIALFVDQSVQPGQWNLAHQLVADLKSGTIPIYGLERQEGSYLPLGVTTGSLADFQLEVQTFAGVTVENVTTSASKWP
ncbi:MAG: hypothetical protein JWN30_238 [Bacilli bacterium]|nr:hypothetical protein [Bacilli bacterium]